MPKRRFEITRSVVRLPKDDQTPVLLKVTVDDDLEYFFSWPTSMEDEGTVASMATIHFVPTMEHAVRVFGDR